MISCCAQVANLADNGTIEVRLHPQAAAGQDLKRTINLDSGSVVRMLYLFLSSVFDSMIQYQSTQSLELYSNIFRVLEWCLVAKQ